MLATLAGFFEREGIRYAVVGAFGLQAYGLGRATMDVDLVAEAEAQRRVLAFLESLGYETLHVSSGYSNHVHPMPEMGRVDLVYVGGDTSRLLFGQCVLALELEERHLPVPRPEHLAAMKVQAMTNDPGRTLQEMADIQFLLQVPGIEEESGATSSVRGYWSDTMRSSGLPEYLSLDRDLPTTSDDVAALARARVTGPEGFAVYLRFLAGFPPPPLAVLRARRGPGGAPFELAAARREGSGAGPLAER